MQVPVYSLKGEIIDHVDISEDVFGIPLNKAVVHQAMVRQLANNRQGTASTKTRGEIKGSTRKLFSQKHTGRARRGNIKSPLLRGGGVTFGPRPRSYHQSMPKKMRRLALRCILSSKAREDSMKVIEELLFEKPRTKDMVDILSALDINSTAIIITEHPNPNVVKSAGNLTNVKVLPSAQINVRDLLSYKALIITISALHNVEKIWGREEINSASL